jgi:hypothetical protein
MVYYRMFNKLKKKGESIMKKVNYDKLNKLSGDDLR